MLFEQNNALEMRKTVFRGHFLLITSGRFIMKYDCDRIVLYFSGCISYKTEIFSIKHTSTKIYIFHAVFNKNHEFYLLE